MSNEPLEYRVRRGVSIRKLILWMTALAVLLSILMAWSVYDTTRSYHDMQEATERYIACREDATSMLEASDYLTEEVREFVITGNTDCVRAFFTEVEETRRRDLALEGLGESFDGTEAYRFLEAALERSNALVEREYYAMRLTIEARGLSLADFPEVLSDISLTSEDAALTPSEMSLLAIDTVFGDVYQSQKQEIRSDVAMCLNTLISATEASQAQSSTHFESLLRRQTVLIALLLVVVFAVVILTMRLVIRPIMNNVLHIRDHQKLPLEGSSELRFLAKTYNVMYDQTQRHQEALSYEASHDELTGLNNRGVFEKMRTTLDPATTTLILVDVDKFKEVNDTWGHDIGDRILKKVASELQGAFRNEDYVCRIGGDEFAILMVHAGSGLRDLVGRKLMAVNEKLQNPTDDLPSVSLSIGVAFGDRENPTEDIFKDADRALYRVKNANRADVAFY